MVGLTLLALFLIGAGLFVTARLAYDVVEWLFLCNQGPDVCN